MDLSEILGELRKERARVDEAIEVLQRLVQRGGMRRGHPPLWLQKMDAKTKMRRRGRPPGSKNKSKSVTTGPSDATPV